MIAPKDHAVGINATVAKVASGAAETVPYFMVTNLARTLGELKERDMRIVGTAEDAPRSLYDVDLTGPVALVFGAEGSGMRQLTARTCDELVHLPMKGAVESLNVSVASGVCLYEAARQRLAAPRAPTTHRDRRGDCHARHRGPASARPAQGRPVARSAACRPRAFARSPPSSAAC